jgi:putative DNA primase/helicase
MSAYTIAEALARARKCKPYKTKNGWLTCCPGHDDQSPSLHVSDGPNGRILFYCNAGCEWDDIRAGLEKKKLWPLNRDNGVQDERPHDETPVKPNDDAERIKQALKLWDEGQTLGETLSLRYLRQRGIELPAKLNALRHHPACRFGEHGKYPALLGLFRTIDGDKPQAIHRTALLANGSDRIREQRDGWDGKWMLGSVAGCAIKLSLHKEVTDRLGIAEGIETALSVLVKGWKPIWAAGSCGALGRFPVVDGIQSLTVFADPGKFGEEAARAVERRWLAAGRECHVKLAKGGDWNDVLRNS